MRRTELQPAVDAGILSAAQADRLAEFLTASAAATPRFGFVHVLYYLGGMIAIGAMTLFMTLGWNSLGGWGGLFIALCYGVLFLALTHRLAERGLEIAAGITATLAVVMVPLSIFFAQMALGHWGADTPYRHFHQTIDGRWLMMELGTLAAAAVLLWRYRLPFMLMPVAVTLWYMSMDLVPLLFGGWFDWQARRFVSLWFGVATILLAFWVDLRSRHSRDYAFWLYLFGVLSFWGGLSLMESRSEWGRLGYLDRRWRVAAVDGRCRRPRSWGGQRVRCVHAAPATSKGPHAHAGGGDPAAGQHTACASTRTSMDPTRGLPAHRPPRPGVAVPAGGRHGLLRAADRRARRHGRFHRRPAARPRCAAPACTWAPTGASTTPAPAAWAPAIATGQALTVHQDDHFDATHIPLTCTAAPVYDPLGRLSAVLDISALSSPQAKSSQHLALQLVKVYAQHVENAHFLRCFPRDWVLKLHPAPSSSRSAPTTCWRWTPAGASSATTARAQLLLQDEHRLGRARPALRRCWTCRFDDLGRFMRRATRRAARGDAARQRAACCSCWRCRRRGARPRWCAPRAAASAERRACPPPLAELSGGDPRLDRQIQRAARLVDSR
jgi:hypothetical protein